MTSTRSEGERQSTDELRECRDYRYIIIIVTDRWNRGDVHVGFWGQSVRWYATHWTNTKLATP